MAMGILSARFYSILFPLPFYRYRIKLWLQRMRVLTRCRSHCDLSFQISSMLIFVHRRNSFSHTHFIPIRSTRPIKLARTMNTFWRISSSERIPTSICTLYVFVRIRLSQLLPPLLLFTIATSRIAQIRYCTTRYSDELVKHLENSIFFRKNRYSSMLCSSENASTEALNRRMFQGNAVSGSFGSNKDDREIRPETFSIVHVIHVDISPRGRS